MGSGPRRAPARSEEEATRSAPSCPPRCAAPSAAACPPSSSRNSPRSRTSPRPASAGCTRSSSTAIGCWRASTGARCGSRPAAASTGRRSFHRVQKALEKLPVVTAFLDGEVIVETEQGTPDFGALQQDLSEGRSDRFCYYLFDLLHLDGIDLTRAALLDRKRALSQLLAGRDDGVLKLSEHFTETRRHRAPARLPPEPRGHRLQARDRALPLGPQQGLAQVQVHRQRRVRRHRLRALHDAAPHGRIARARLFRQGQARLRRPRRLGLLDRGCRRSVAPARSHSHRRPRRSTRCRRWRRGATCAGSSRSWSPRSRCAVGRPTASCATPCSRGCGRTRTPPTWRRRSRS